MLGWILFVGLSIPIVIFSLPSLRNPNVHGFYRFFAFESIAGIIGLNCRVWFHDPFALHQVFSWLFLTVSLLPAGIGFYQLMHIGKPDGNFENTTKLVTVGIYRYLRHPLYASVFYLALGAFLKDITIATSLLVLCTTIAISMTAHTEERENLEKFGDEYREYMKKTKRFVPFVY
jgi:protein-S-isoprenylcysteine O-methyltransferase Ste14